MFGWAWRWVDREVCNYPFCEDVGALACVPHPALGIRAIGPKGRLGVKSRGWMVEDGGPDKVYFSYSVGTLAHVCIRHTWGQCSTSPAQLLTLQRPIQKKPSSSQPPLVSDDSREALSLHW
jgi:hypothetical protein